MWEPLVIETWTTLLAQLVVMLIGQLQHQHLIFTRRKPCQLQRRQRWQIQRGSDLRDLLLTIFPGAGDLDPSVLSVVQPWQL